MRRNRRVKILATLGPASSDRVTIANLFRAGADLFRINMSHTDHDMLRRLVATIRDVEAEIQRPIGILADLQGPKLRIGVFADRTVTLTPGQSFTLDDDPTPGTKDRVELPHTEILAALIPGHRLLLDDGKVRLRVVEATAHRAVTVVEVGTVLSNRKGVSVPDSMIDLPAMTEKDHADLLAALAAEVDWIALSFIQRAEDLIEARKIVRGRAGILAKIEKPQAVEHLGAIIEQADALMVARGDLGVELPLEAVPGRQKQIVRAARKAGKPVVVATQMLESMIAASVPTRAEVSDVATAVFEGADAVMLSAETASGAYPIEAVQVMDRIAQSVENDPLYTSILESQRNAPEETTADAIMAAVHQVTHTVHAKAVVCWTKSGSTGLRAARERPEAPIIVLTPLVETARRLALGWGLHCVTTEDAHDLDDVTDRAARIAWQEGFARAGDRVVVTAGVPLGTPGSTNLLRVAFVGPKNNV